MPSENVSLSEENARLRKALKEREAEIAFLKKHLWNPTLCQGVDNNISRLLHF